MKIYIACLKNLVTGGIELLHQLCHELNEYKGIEAYIWYEDSKDAVIPDVYRKYENKVAINGNPSKDAILIFPEVWAYKLNLPKYKDNQKCIYFESVNYYVENIPKSQYLVFPENTIFMVQSFYAMNFLRENKIHDSIFITDYINDEFMNADPDKPKKRQILYNPAKGLDWTKKVIEKMPNETFIPIRDMKPNQVRELMEESMVYIDFGHHPGKDRIPREAALCGCCVITSTDGSANFFSDVPIGLDYKISKSNYWFVRTATEQITKCLDNYDKYKADFDDYRLDIKREYRVFKVGVGWLVNKLRR